MSQTYLIIFLGVAFQLDSERRVQRISKRAWLLPPSVFLWHYQTQVLNWRFWKQQEDIIATSGENITQRETRYYQRAPAARPLFKDIIIQQPGHWMHLNLMASHLQDVIKQCLDCLHVLILRFPLNRAKCNKLAPTQHSFSVACKTATQPRFQNHLIHPRFPWIL